jgi:hypothetical protein
MTTREILGLIRDNEDRIRIQVADFLRLRAVYNKVGYDTVTRIDFIESVRLDSFGSLDIKAGVIAREQLGYAEFSNTSFAPDTYFASGTLRIEVNDHGRSFYGESRDVLYEAANDSPKINCRFDVMKTINEALNDLRKKLKK